MQKSVRVDLDLATSAYCGCLGDSCSARCSRHAMIVTQLSPQHFVGGYSRRVLRRWYTGRFATTIFFAQFSVHFNACYTRRFLAHVTVPWREHIHH